MARAAAIGSGLAAAAVLLAAARSRGAEPVAGRQPDTFRLARTFTPGTEIRYSYTSAFDQELRAPGQADEVAGMRLAGAVSEFVAEFNARTGVALIGRQGDDTAQMLDGPNRKVTCTREQTWLAAFRVTTAGLARQRSGVGPIDAVLRRHGVNRIGEDAQICAAFPCGAVGAGAEWQGEVLVPLPWGREVGHAVSRIVDVSTRDGRRVCLIRSQIDLESLGCSGYRPTAMSPRMRVQGTAEGLLDLDRGLWQEMRWDLASAFEGSGFEGETRLTSAIELEAVRTLPPREDARRRRHVRALDAALSLVYAGHVDKALGRLEKDERRAEAGAWKSGLSVALALLEPLRETGADGAVASREAEPGGPEAALMREADTAACGGNWEKAVAAYERFVKRFPRHDWVPECLAAAAMICEQKLNRPDKAGALNNKAVAFLEEAAGGKRQPMALYELAGAYARAGQLAKAADAYRSFLMTRDGEMEPGSKMLGYYRLGGLLEEMGETGAAVEAYQALERLTPENDYSKRLKQKAEARLRELAGEKGGSANEAGDGK